MSDSLRDQLLKAGFSQTKPTAKPMAKPTAKPKPQSKGKSKSSAHKKSHSQPQSKSAPKSTPSASDTPVQTQPKAGYTHVPNTPVKKKKAKKAPAVKSRTGSWSTRDHTASAKTQRTEDPAAAEKRRAMKAQIQTLIDASALKDYKGEEIYRFTLQNKIRELLVTDAVRKQLAGGEFAITRLNGATRIIPAATATAIRAINPQWLVFLTTDVDDSIDDDDEFPIPDDLIW